MLCFGIVVGSSAFHKRILELDGQMPGDASDEWQMMAALAADESARLALAGKVCEEEGATGAARLMRAFVREELHRRLRRVLWLCNEFGKFLPHEAAEKRRVRGELEEMLSKLQEN